jgi:phosphatidylinositol glycan class B
MRGWLQPGLAYLVIRTVQSVGIDDPFHQALVLRLLSASVFWFGLRQLTLSSRLWSHCQSARRWSVRLTWLAFFLPYLAVRTSSESLGSALLLLGLAKFASVTLGSGANSCLLLAGTLFGAAFQARYAVGVMIAGIVAWGLLRRVLDAPGVARLGLGFAATLALAAPIDYWGYGEWTLPVLNYLDQNLVRGVAAARFGALPWYGYVELALHNALAPLLLLAYAGTVLGWLRHPGHLLTAASLPFVLLHTLLAHKEMRFLFPVAVLAPGLMVLGCAGLTQGPGLGGRAGRALLKLAFGLNLGALAAFTLVPNRPEVGFQRFVYRRFPERFDAVLLARSPFEFSGLQMRFYWPRHLKLSKASSLDATLPQSHLVITPVFERPYASRFRCELLYSSYPPWLERFQREHLAVLLPGWALHRCLPLSGAV